MVREEVGEGEWNCIHTTLHCAFTAIASIAKDRYILYLHDAIPHLPTVYKPLLVPPLPLPTNHSHT